MLRRLFPEGRCLRYSLQVNAVMSISTQWIALDLHSDNQPVENDTQESLNLLHLLQIESLV